MSTFRPPRRARVPLPVAKQIAATARNVFKARGFQQDHIVRHWPEIVGASLSGLSMPEKLAFPRTKSNESPRRSEGATLTVRVDGPGALEFAHQEPQILERINSYYGYQAVTRIKLVQAPLPLPKANRKRQIATLSPRQEETLQSETAQIQSDALRASLEELGRRVLGSQKRPNLPGTRRR
jgi:hypothetical protein